MKIIFAQGNPEARYARTRHNVGWMIVDEYARHLGVEFVAKPKFFAFVAQHTINGEKILLVKPTTYYNETGQSARAILDFYKLELSDMIVIHDELSLPFGTIRIRRKGRDAGNNGIKSLNAHLGESYLRLRIGVWSELRDRMDDADFVLSTFSKLEQETIDSKLLEPSIGILDQFVAETIAETSLSV